MTYEATVKLKGKPAQQFRELDDAYDSINSLIFTKDNTQWIIPFQLLDDAVIITKSEER